MIESLKLTNFRKHRNTEVSFSQGLHVVRGPNEGGKSTLIEGILYALGGVRTLRDSLEDCVTWDEPLNSLKVTLVIVVDGVRYTVTRSKAGCECIYAGGTCTGQSEVTNFMARLLKADMATASKLMMSSQLDIRGALEAGPKATSELIERLSEFNQIDDLIELMGAKLETGSAAPAQQALTTAQATLAELAAVEAPDFDAMAQAVKGAESTVDLARKLEGETRKAYEADVTRHAQVKAADGERRRLDVQVQGLQRQLAQASEDLKCLRDNPVNEPVNAEAEIQCMLEKKSALKGLVDASLAYKAVAPLLGVAGEYKGTADAWQDEMRRTQVELDEQRKVLSDTRVEIATQLAKLNSGNCSFCGQDFSDLPAVKAKNDEINLTLATLGLKQQKADGQVAWLVARIARLNQFQTDGRPVLAAAKKYAQYLDVDGSTYPPTLTWKGEVPDVDGTPTDYDGCIAKVRAAVGAYAKYLREIIEKEGDAKIATRDLEAAKKRSSEIGAPENVAESEQKLINLNAELKEAVDALDEAKSMLSVHVGSQRDAKREWAHAVERKGSAEAAVEAAQARITTLEFNNALVKRVRVCRPLLADQLWNLVLSSVSSYFSELRGIKSKVSKSADGFFIDGHKVTSFSGSALDILGLAIRVALVRTFLPTAPFLILDEPAAACSDERTGNMLGFLSTVGFQQVILCSHDPISDSVADGVTLVGDLV